MLSKALQRRVIIGISLTAVLLAVASFKATLQDGALLEVNAHLNDLMTSPHSLLLAPPAPIAGRALGEDKKEGASFKKAAVANASLDAWFDRSQTQALIVQKERSYCLSALQFRCGRWAQYQCNVYDESHHCHSCWCRD